MRFPHLKIRSRRPAKFNFLVKYGTRRPAKFNSIVKYVSLEGRQIHLGNQEAPEHPQRAQEAHYVAILCQSSAWEAIM